MNTINMISALLASVILIGMAIFVLIKDWKNQVNRYYVFWNVMALGILFTMFITYAMPDSPDLTTINRITQMFSLLFSHPFLPCPLSFPGEKNPFLSI